MIIKNIEVNWAPVRIRPSGRAGDSGRDTFEKEKEINCQIKIIKRASKGFRFGLTIRVGPGSRVGTGLISQIFIFLIIHLGQVVETIYGFPIK